MANQSIIPEISHFITSYDPQGKSAFLAAPNPPLVQQSSDSLRVDYIYSTVASPNGPVLTDMDDYSKNEDVRREHPYVMFPLAGGSAAMVASVRFHIFSTLLINNFVITTIEVCTESGWKGRIYASIADP